MKEVNFWKHDKVPVRQIKPVKIKMPKIEKQTRDLIKTAVGVGIGLAVLGAGLQAFQEATD